MTVWTAPPTSPGTAVVVFQSPVLEQLLEALQELGLAVEGFSNVDEALAYVTRADVLVSVVVANGSLPGVLNGADLATTLSQSYPTLPIVLADHFEGLVADNVMCLDKGWTVEEMSDQVAAMVARLPEGSRPSVTA